ncbi:MAG: hypothetical protein HY043_12200 [Verrucomicrobia bacterium]|nr:hypothetical protein [Verrucomicrobiota bacterium]
MKFLPPDSPKIFNARSIRRREFLQIATGTFALGIVSTRAASRANPFRLATFSTEVTPPLGHALMGGGIAPAQQISDPLFARGLVLLDAGKPIVICAIDWCEIRNDAYERWRAVLARAARTEPVRVLVTSVHVHDAPIADLEAQRILNRHSSAGSICDLTFHEQAVQRVAQALSASLKSPAKITHFGIDQAKVERVASNRRYLLADGTPNYGRMSRNVDPVARAADEGTIDPWLKTLSFWNEERAVAALHCYATHPMSHYGRGEVSSDFVGAARARRQSDDPGVFQIYTAGCSGNVTAGKYNDGADENRSLLAGRIYDAMNSAWSGTQRQPLTRCDLSQTRLRLKPRSDGGYTVPELEARLRADPKPFGQCLAALGLSWRKRLAKNSNIDLPLIDFGAAQLLLLPGESYVEYQLLAQRLRPESFVMTMGYGECAPGYIPIERAWRENDSNLRDWCWVAPGAEAEMTRALRVALRGNASH